MIQRERLLKMIDEGFSKTPCYIGEDCNGKECIYCGQEALADYLLANGVIVPPVKVGDVVWLIVTGKPLKFAVTYVYFVKDEFTELMHIEAEKENEADFVFVPTDIGKTVFLSREEAEAALRERS